MTLPNREAFTAKALADGFAEVLERRWPLLAVVAEHSHPFAIEAVVVAGEMWLTIGDNIRHLQAGDRFALARNLPHAECYGPSGAAYWAARRP